MKTRRKKQILIIGQGSSGQRFKTFLKKTEYELVWYQYRKNVPLVEVPYKNLIAAIIASPTHTHIQYAKVLLDRKVPLLIEKPLTDNLMNSKKILNQARAINTTIMTGFNLRFLPVIRLIDQYVKEERLGNILFADIHVGQYLPFWRPQKDYRDSYSAHYDQGGGVALDLIHEIDLALGWFGKLKLDQVLSEHRSRLDTDAEDFVRLTFEKPFPIQITLECLSHVPVRRYFIVGTKGTIHCDMYNHIFHFVASDGSVVKKTTPSLFDIQSTYEREVNAFLSIIKNKIPVVPTERSLGIDALEIALKARRHGQRK